MFIYRLVLSGTCVGFVVYRVLTETSSDIIGVYRHDFVKGTASTSSDFVFNQNYLKRTKLYKHDITFKDGSNYSWVLSIITTKEEQYSYLSNIDFESAIKLNLQNYMGTNYLIYSFSFVGNGYNGKYIDTEGAITTTNFSQTITDTVTAL